MNVKKFTVIFALFCILLCCFSSVNAAEDVYTNLDDVVTIDGVQEYTSDNAALEKTHEDISESENILSSDETTDEIINETKIVENNKQSQTRGQDINVDSWDDLKNYGGETTDYNIYLSGPITVDKTVLVFHNSATIIGTPSNYITGGYYTKIPFQSTGDLNISFINVTFKNMDASVLIKLATSGHNTFINCSFDNIHTYAYKSSVIWNDKGLMNIYGCNFTNCNDGFGAVTNYATSGTVQMNVENCRFENNTGRFEPGAINNCGELNVTNSQFIHNTANWWAGAIHTHTFAYTRIIGSNFTNNVAGWNGGALFSYGTLEVIKSNFTNNNCSTNTGGGAICGYSYQGSIYNITVDSCNFTHNINKNSNGRGGAIGVQNIGYLTVFNSTFKDNNNATNGTAISAICENITYCTNCTSCNCPNCPNCTNCTHLNSTGNPECNIYNNTFLNQEGPGNAVVISGNNYLFYDNIFRNSIQTIHYNESGNDWGLSANILTLNQRTLLCYNGISEALSAKSDFFYVNGSKQYNSEDDGQSLENAIGASGFYKAISNIKENGIIYITGTFSYDVWRNAVSNRCKEFTIIGVENPIVNDGEWEVGNEPDCDHYPDTFINITFACPGLIYGNDLTFINCTFINFKTIDPINDGIDENSEYGVEPPEESFITNFINCDFINSTLGNNNLIDIAKYTQINFNNCNFENITANSIVSSYKGKYHDQDSINFNNCKFTNVTTKGIVSIPTGREISELVHIEGCTYDVLVTNDVLTDSNRYYINTTQSRTETIIKASIDNDGNLLINLTDINGNSLAEDEISISINGEDAEDYQVEKDGTLTIPVTDLTDLTGKVTIIINYPDNNEYKGNSTTIEYIIRNATIIDASDLNITVNVTKNLTVTLKDINGNVLAGKEIKVTVNNQNSTVTTDENGVANIPITHDEVGVYEYNLFFAGDELSYKNSTKIVSVNITEAKTVDPVNNSTNNTNNGTNTGSNTNPTTPSKDTTTKKVTKSSTKITAKKATFKAKKKSKKYTITLKSGKKAVSKVKVTIKVGKKTYKATTNKKGKATFNLKKLTKKGKYTAVIKFAGKGNYLKSSKKVKIIIK